MPSARRLLVATLNHDKLREIRQILQDIGWEILSLNDFPAYPEPRENGDTFAANALIKARRGFEQTGVLTLSDDSGLEVDWLDGRPGVHSARYAGDNATHEANVDLLLRELDGVPAEKRTARFRCVMALVGDKVEITWEGVSEGRITTEKRGCSGFGYDPVFWSPEIGMNFAEASAEQKNRVSHRGRALRDLANVLHNLT